mmetsp:Transcript_14279/g.20872  ORF Transcript_14279/g.20872 Transcript_14279/m.20872 type:complete len:339 (+) Transcript_14279:64-1080(+)
MESLPRVLSSSSRAARSIPCKTSDPRPGLSRAGESSIPSKLSSLPTEFKLCLLGSFMPLSRLASSNTRLRLLTKLAVVVFGDGRTPRTLPRRDRLVCVDALAEGIGNTGCCCCAASAEPSAAKKSCAALASSNACVSSVSNNKLNDDARRARVSDSAASPKSGRSAPSNSEKSFEPSAAARESGSSLTSSSAKLSASSSSSSSSSLSAVWWELWSESLRSGNASNWSCEAVDEARDGRPPEPPPDFKLAVQPRAAPLEGARENTDTMRWLGPLGRRCRVVAPLVVSRLASAFAIASDADTLSCGAFTSAIHDWRVKPISTGASVRCSCCIIWPSLSKN